jgi:hypothetical protein
MPSRILEDRQSGITAPGGHEYTVPRKQDGELVLNVRGEGTTGQKSLAESEVLAPRVPGVENREGVVSELKPPRTGQFTGASARAAQSGIERTIGSEQEDTIGCHVRDGEATIG